MNEKRTVPPDCGFFPGAGNAAHPNAVSMNMLMPFSS